MVRRNLKADALQGLHDTPVGAPGKKGRGTLDHRHSFRAQVAPEQAVESRSIELSQGVIGGVGKIDHDKIKKVRVLFQPYERHRR